MRRNVIWVLITAGSLLFAVAVQAQNQGQSLCGAASGTRFNLEPASMAVPQNEPPVDFILNGVALGDDLIVQHGNDRRWKASPWGTSAVYVHADTTSCSPTFDAQNPPIPDPLHPTQNMIAWGDPQVRADPSRNQFILTDLRANQPTTALGVVRVPTANLLKPTVCPAGTLTTAQAQTCFWSNGGAAVVVNESALGYTDVEKMTQDPRSSGTGAGDIYIVNSFFVYGTSGPTSSMIQLTACKGLFLTAADCAPTITISGADSPNFPHFPSVSVVPGGPNAGTLTISYMEYPTGNEYIRYVTCTPNGAPQSPTCTSPVTITEPSPNWVYRTSSTSRALTDMTIDNYTIPTIINRYNPSGPTPQTTFVVYEVCGTSKKLPMNSACPNADISMAYSSDLTTWTIASVDATPASHEFMPAVALDEAQNVINIAYYKTPPGDIFKNRTLVYLVQIQPGTTTPGTPIPITTSPDSPDADANLPFEPQYGDYIGVAAHGTGGAGNSRLYVGHTNVSRIGTYYSGATNPESNNHVSSYSY